MELKNQAHAMSRRNFIKLSALSGCALTIAAYLPAFGKNSVQIITGQSGDIPPSELMCWISIETSGKVTIMNHRSEMGQGTYQAIPQVIAEELEVNPGDITVQFAAANPKKFGPQPQDGSFSIRGWYLQLLKVGATAREMLIEAASKQWNVPLDECYAENGQIIHRATGRKLNYGQLVNEAAKLIPPQDVKLKNRQDYKIIGKPLSRLDIPLKTDGTATFGMDVRLPGMLYAVVERSARFRGKVRSFDDSATKSIPGVRHVFKVERAVFTSTYEGVAVVAETLWAAMQGRKALIVDWDDDGFEHVGTEQLYDQKLANLRKPALSENVEEAFHQATKKLEAFYETPYQSHSCLEPVNCTAHVQENKIEIWGPIQEANMIQSDLSQRFAIPIENVTVNMTFLGGGFGRKAFTDYPHEAALISKEIKGPVQVVWTREDDMTMGPFRPGACYFSKAGLDSNGKIMAYQSVCASQWIGQAWSPEPYPDPEPLKSNSGHMDGLLKPYYTSIPNFSFGGAGTRAPIPVLWWRSVYASTSAFACESFIDELAHEAGKDPLEFRRAHLPEVRYQALIDKMESISGWKSRMKNGGWGVAITECFGSIVAHIVKVARNKKGKVIIDKVFAIMDCGWYVNPDIIRAQVEGSIVMAIGAATKHEIHFKDGRTVEKNFDTYKMPRINDIPEIEVHIMENDEKAGGVGEPGLPPFAPALCNAIFDLTGKRIRKLPFNLNDI